MAPHGSCARVRGIVLHRTLLPSVLLSRAMAGKKKTESKSVEAGGSSLEHFFTTHLHAFALCTLLCSILSTLRIVILCWWLVIFTLLIPVSPIRAKKQSASDHSRVMVVPCLVGCVAVCQIVLLSFRPGRGLGFAHWGDMRDGMVRSY